MASFEIPGSPLDLRGALRPLTLAPLGPLDVALHLERCAPALLEAEVADRAGTSLKAALESSRLPLPDVFAAAQDTDPLPDALALSDGGAALVLTEHALHLAGLDAVLRSDRLHNNRTPHFLAEDLSLACTASPDLARLRDDLAGLRTQRLLDLVEDLTGRPQRPPTAPRTRHLARATGGSPLVVFMYGPEWSLRNLLSRALHLAMLEHSGCALAEVDGPTRDLLFRHGFVDDAAPLVPGDSARVLETAASLPGTVPERLEAARALEDDSNL
jgi:hypothetical protein